MQSISEIFRNLFKLLSKRTQWIFKKIQGMCKNCRAVFPSREYIANEVGCSVRTVARALLLFQINGWIVVKKRPYQSNVYFMDESLIELNLDNPKTFMKVQEKPENVPQNVPVLEVSIRKEIDTYKQDVPKHVFNFLKISGISFETQVYLTKTFSECVMWEALKDAKWYALELRKEIHNLEAFLTSRAKYHRNQNNK